MRREDNTLNVKINQFFYSLSVITFTRRLVPIQTNEQMIAFTNYVLEMHSDHLWHRHRSGAVV